MSGSEQPWSDADIARLKALWKDPTQSTLAIGRALNRSKNSIVGKAGRVGCPSRASPIIRRSKAECLERPMVRVRRAGAVTLSPAPSSAPSSVPSPVPVAEAVPSKPMREAAQAVAARLCCWPLDAASRRRFVTCDAPVAARKPYCPAHCARAYSAPRAAASQPPDGRAEMGA